MKRLAAGLLCVCALPATAAAHVVDEYLQVAQIALESDGVRVELRLIPGAQLADRIFALIDLDDDGLLSPAEQQAYARRVLQDVTLDVDGRRANLALADLAFPVRREMNEGVGVIRLKLAAQAALGMAGDHRVEFRNDHLPELGAYLANMLVPASDKIEVLRQQRDPRQHGLRVDLHTRTAASRWFWGAGLGLFGLCLSLVVGRVRLSARTRNRQVIDPGCHGFDIR